jgi:hypothetical protein
MGPGGLRYQVTVAVAEQIGRRGEDVRFDSLHLLHTAARGQLEKHLLHQVVDFVAGDMSIREIACERRAQPLRQCFHHCARPRVGVARCAS